MESDKPGWLSNQEAIEAAHKNLEEGPWDYLVGAAESETTMRRNRLALDMLAFRPRVCVDVTNVDPSTTFLGHKVRIPVLLSPIGSLQLFSAGGAADAARAAAEFGTIPIVSSSTQPAPEETAAAAEGPKIFQLYNDGDWEWVKDLLTRVKNVGFNALALTVDTAVYSRRERPMISRYTPPTRQAPPDAKWRASVTWDFVDRVKDFMGLPFLLKGVATAEDAELAVQHGVDVVWVSNHGGRQLDHGRGAIEVLPEVVKAVNGRAQVMFDSGIQRGTDVLKAIALGADVVGIGKMEGWGLAGGGVPGLVRVLEILENELKVDMGLLGVTRLAELNRSYIAEADPVSFAHEMSQFVNIDAPEGRLF